MEDKLICPAEITADKDSVPAFSVNSPYDLDAVLFMRKYALLRSSNNFTVITLIISLIMALSSALLGYYLITITAGFIFLLMIFVISQIKPSAKRIYERLYKDEELRRYNFYEDHFTAESVRGAFYIKYETIKKAVFDEKYILLFMPDGRCFIISKEKIHDNDNVVFIKRKFNIPENKNGGKIK